MDFWLRFPDVEPGSRICRIGNGNLAWLAPRVLSAPDGRTRQRVPAGAHACTEEGGRTTGVAYRLPDATLEEELTLLWKREMITGCYMPSWCKLELDDGRTVNALVFIMDPRHPLYEADTRTQVIAPLIAAASGPLGTNAQYLFSLDQELTRLGMQDECLNELVMKVKALLEGNLLNNPLRPGFA